MVRVGVVFAIGTLAIQSTVRGVLKALAILFETKGTLALAAILVDAAEGWWCGSRSTSSNSRSCVLRWTVRITSASAPVILLVLMLVEVLEALWIRGRWSQRWK
jgi:hypothetical protein